MIHNMKLNKKPFEMIKNGVKTIELRLNDSKRQAVRVGDTIVFQNLENTEEKLQCSVKNLYPFASFEELYEKLPLNKCGYTDDDISEANAEDMKRYYTEEQQRKYGVLGIEIELL